MKKLLLLVMTLGTFSFSSFAINEAEYNKKLSVLVSSTTVEDRLTAIEDLSAILNAGQSSSLGTAKINVGSLKEGYLNLTCVSGKNIDCLKIGTLVKFWKCTDPITEIINQNIKASVIAACR